MTTWLIIAVFYLPLHFMGPLGAVILIMAASRYRRWLLRTVFMECILSMLTGFVLAIWLATGNLKIAMFILFASMLFPYLMLMIHRIRTPGRFDGVDK